MKDYGIQQSTLSPAKIEILEDKVFTATDITPITTEETEEQPGFVGFEFHLIEYEKDEYIKLQANRNDALEATLWDTQLALCDIYEMIGG